MWDQAYVIAGWVVFTPALLLGAWALFEDWVHQRFNKRKRCPRCWYDMSRSPTLTCSECGDPLRPEEVTPRLGPALQSAARELEAAGGDSSDIPPLLRHGL